MGWERGYYYRVRKVRGRVVREYVGRGLIGELSAQIDADRRALREERQASLKAEMAELAELEAPVADLCQQMDLIVRAAMKAAGYRQHNRGNGGRNVGALTRLTDAETREVADAEQFLKRADSGDESVLPALRKLLEEPDVVEMMGGDFWGRVRRRRKRSAGAAGSRYIRPRNEPKRGKGARDIAYPRRLTSGNPQHL